MINLSESAGMNHPSSGTPSIDGKNTSSYSRADLTGATQDRRAPPVGRTRHPHVQENIEGGLTLLVIGHRNDLLRWMEMNVSFARRYAR
jgi:hypothetical protein